MFIKVLNKLEEGVLSLLLVFATLLVFADVVARFVFNTGWLWSQELTLHLSAWFVLIGASYGIKMGSHIGVDAVVRLLPDRAHRVVAAIAVLLSLAYCGFYLAGAYSYLRIVWITGITLEDIPVPQWLAHSILPLGLSFLVIRLLLLLWSVVTGKSFGFTFANEAKHSMQLAQHEDDKKGAGA